MREHTPVDVLGLGAALPGPGWTVLDAARDQRFTGELIAEADAIVRVYFDRGRIYVAERATDPSLGTRLVEAGALNRAQLEYGTLRIGEIEHLGRLFDRVPSVNRDGVLVLNELMTEECVRWLAGQQVTAVTATPYRHHDSGMHRWELFELPASQGTAGSVPEMALPAPDPTSSPVIAAESTGALIATSPAITAPSHEHLPVSTFDELFLDDLVEWTEPAPFSPAAPPVPPRADRSNLLTDTDAWIDDLVADGLTTAPVEGSTTRQKLAPLPVRQVDDFQLIWPSGEKGDVAAARPDNGDADRVGPTARVGRDPADPAESGSADRPDSDEEGPSPLAVRRAVATIDTGSLEARRRLVDASGDLTTPPGRVAIQRESSIWRNGPPRQTTSVFDAPVAVEEAADTPAASSNDHDGRANALRRLIGSLRRP